VTEFAVYVLRDLASTHATPSASAGEPGAAIAEATSTSEQPLSAREIEAIRRRLRVLGYL
jgi:hypothetical protein